MKKFLILVMAGVFACSMTAFASAPGTEARSVSENAVIDKVIESFPLEVAEQILGTSLRVAAPVVQAPAKPAAELAAELSGKSVSEWAANAIMETPGLEDAAAVAQGGSIVIDGAASGATFTVERVERGTTEFAKSQANAIGGELLNVVTLSAPGVAFGESQVTFYVEGVTAGQKIAVYQCVKGQWVPLTVNAVTEEGVEVTMTSLGTIAFFAL